MAQETRRQGQQPEGKREEGKQQGSGRQQYECKTCRRSFISPNELRQHEESEHRGQSRNQARQRQHAVCGRAPSDVTVRVAGWKPRAPPAYAARALSAARTR